MILAATPNPDPDDAGVLSIIVEAAIEDANGGEDVFDVSVREGGGAIAAPPPEEAEKRQGQLVFVRFDANPNFEGGKFKSRRPILAGNSNRRSQSSRGRGRRWGRRATP